MALDRERSLRSVVDRAAEELGDADARHALYVVTEATVEEYCLGRRT